MSQRSPRESAIVSHLNITITLWPIYRKANGRKEKINWWNPDVTLRSLLSELLSLITINNISKTFILYQGGAITAFTNSNTIVKTSQS